MCSGYFFKCKKCKNKYSATTGIGMLYPEVYKEVVEDIRNGKYGNEWQNIMNSEKFIAVNAEDEVYICNKCNH